MSEPRVPLDVLQRDLDRYRDWYHEQKARSRWLEGQLAETRRKYSALQTRFDGLTNFGPHGRLMGALLKAAVPLEALHADNHMGARWMAPSVRDSVAEAVVAIRAVVADLVEAKRNA